MILPEFRIAPLRGGPVLRWGVVAPGNIAAAWVKSVQQNTDQIVAAVASRALGRAEEFAGRFAVPSHMTLAM